MADEGGGHWIGGNVYAWGFANRGSGYGNGDVDYSGSINSDDYFYIDLGFASQEMPLAPPAALSGKARPSKKVLTHHRRHRRHHVTQRLFLLPTESRFRR